MLSFLSVSESGSGSTLPDPDLLVRGMDPDPNPSMRLLQKSEIVCRAHKYQCRPCESGKVHENASRCHRVLIKAVRVPIVIVGEPKEAARVYNTLTALTTLSQP